MSANLGKISITVGGDHVISNTYERLTLAKSSGGVWYLSLWDVPSNIALTDLGYWRLFFDPNMNSQQVADNAADIVSILQTLATKSDTGHTHDYVPLSDVSALSSPNTIVKRSSNGYIYANYINTDIGDSSPVPTDVFMNHRGNGFIYKQPFGYFLGHVKGTTPSWLYATLVNGFTQWIRYRKWQSGLVEVQLYALNSAGSSGYANTLVCTLPVGFRPSVIQRKAISTTRAGYCVDGYLNTDGALYTQVVGAHYHFASFTYMT